MQLEVHTENSQRHDRKPRSRVFLAAEIFDGNDWHSVTIRDLAPHGALISGITLPTGTRAILAHNEKDPTFEHEHHVTVVWNKGAKCGLLFDDKFEEEHFLRPVTVKPSQANPFNQITRSNRPSISPAKVTSKAEIMMAADWYRGKYG